MTKLTSTFLGDVARHLARAAATIWLLLLLLPADSTGQLIDRRSADSLSAQHILEIAARDSLVQRRSEAIALTLELIRGDPAAAPRTDSLLAGLRDLAYSGIDATLHMTALNALLASGSTRGQHAMLLTVFDSARNAPTRAAILRVAHTLPDSVRRELLLRGVQLSGTASASYVANLAALMALQWQPQGSTLLWEALIKNLIHDERAARAARAGLQRSIQK